MDFFTFICISVLVATSGAPSSDAQPAQSDTPCVAALRRFPAPDVTYTAKHLWNDCPELCKNSSGHFPTGQFPHPWDCNAFINCYNDDAWVAWCQTGLLFNENNLQCDWPRNVDCKRYQPSQFSQPPGLTTQSQWELLPTTPSSVSGLNQQSDVQTCKDSETKLNDRELLGDRADLCTSGSGNYRAPDCRFYVKCLGIRAYVVRCPGGFVFDPVGKQCDWPSKNPSCLKSCLNAGNYDTTTQQPVTPPVLDVEVRTQNLSCNESHCIPKAGCRAELCKQPKGQFQIPGDCSRFANCWNSCAYVTDCPNGMVFIESKGQCDNSWSLPSTDQCYKSAYGGDNNAANNSGMSQQQGNAGGDAFRTSQSQSMNGGSMTQTQE